MLIALDTIVLLDLVEETEDVTDAFPLILRRIQRVQFLMPPTVQEELAAEVLSSEDFTDRKRAQTAFQLARRWNVLPGRLTEVQHGVSRRIGRRLRSIGLLPEAEVNDGLIFAEAAVLGCSLLLSSDEHLRGMDFGRLSFELRALGSTAPVIATPREVVRKFFT